MPEDDVFFIANVKMEDMGIYSCMAQNIAGGLSANATLTVLGECDWPVLADLPHLQCKCSKLQWWRAKLKCKEQYKHWCNVYTVKL